MKANYLLVCNIGNSILVLDILLRDDHVIIVDINSYFCRNTASVYQLFKKIVDGILFYTQSLTYPSYLGLVDIDIYLIQILNIED